MQQALLEFIKRHQLLAPDEKVLVAVSGGRDSMALAHALKTLGFETGLIHMNFRLRGEDSDQDAELVARFAEEHGLPHFQEAAWEKPPQENIQLAARTARYAYFERCATEHGYQRIATAHHFDDRVESLFINLLRGTGIHGLNGIPLQSGKVIRPLLWATRSEIDSYIDEHDIPYRDDASNATDSYARNRIRHHLIPILETIDPSYRDKLLTSLTNLSQDAALIDRMAEDSLHPAGENAKIDLSIYPTADRGIWLYHALRQYGFNRSQCEDLMSSQENGKQIETSNCRAVKEGESVHVIHTSTSSKTPLVINDAGKYHFDGCVLQVRLTNDQTPIKSTDNRQVTLDRAQIKFPLTVRGLNPGDEFQPLGLDYRVDARKFLREKGHGAADLDQSYVLTDQSGKICWIPETQIAEWCKVDSGTTSLLSLSFHRNGA